MTLMASIGVFFYRNVWVKNPVLREKPPPRQADKFFTFLSFLGDLAVRVVCLELEIKPVSLWRIA